jgi:hypothetical protein
MQNFIAKSPEWIKNTWASRNSEETEQDGWTWPNPSLKTPPQNTHLTEHQRQATQNRRQNHTLQIISTHTNGGQVHRE